MRGRMALSVALFVGLGLSLPAAAAATSRGDFVAQAETLCTNTNQAISKTSDQLYHRYKKLRPKGRYRDWSKAQKRRDDFLFFNGYGRVLVYQGKAINTLDRQLQALPEPPNDESVIAQWIESRRVDADLIKGSGRQIKRAARRKPHRAINYLFAFDSIQDQLGLTDLIVGSFGFDACYLADQSA